MSVTDWFQGLFLNCRECEFVDVPEGGPPWLSRGCVTADYWSPGLAPESHHHCRWFRWVAR